MAFRVIWLWLRYWYGYHYVLTREFARAYRYVGGPIADCDLYFFDVARAKWVAFFTGYLFVGGTRLYRSMTLEFAHPLVKTGDVGFAYGLLETGNTVAIILAPLVAGFIYNYKPDAVFTIGLAVIALTMVLSGLLLREKRIVRI